MWTIKFIYFDSKCIHLSRPYPQGGLGLKDIGLQNDSLLKKLTWKFMTFKSFAFSFLRERYLTQLRKSHVGFRVRFPDLCSRIDRVAISLVKDSLVWAYSRDGQFPTNDRLCRAEFHLASRCSVCRVSSESSYHLFIRCPLAAAFWEAVFSAFQRHIYADTWSSFFSQAMSVSFSDQMRVLWKTTIHAVVWSVWLARNQWIFEIKAMDFRYALSLVWRAVSDANWLEIGCMRNCVDDLLILRRFDLRGRPLRAPSIMSVIWSPPAPGWTKVNTDGAALSSPGAGGCKGIFCNCRAFVKGCFAVPLNHVFAFEAELLAASITINFAWQNGWHLIWLESDYSYVVQLLSSRSEQIL
ncbi:hypothetical protein Ddye_028951 [Dipteronia dyeriana]|uniref:Reverse transcriptase zinc-binding domain-containing protein n=1 Tax=Dipteronia dyeriana TaxID=168575 RepID=A0AAD9TEN7_9ROSI|nr:hypothetical protein Ddye_028951 [Dipteronia dyeriana]